jgi:hypothetical protein
MKTTKICQSQWFSRDSNQAHPRIRIRNVNTRPTRSAHLSRIPSLLQSVIIWVATSCGRLNVYQSFLETCLHRSLLPWTWKPHTISNLSSISCLLLRLCRMRRLSSYGEAAWREVLLCEQKHLFFSRGHLLCLPVPQCTVDKNFREGTAFILGKLNFVRVDLIRKSLETGIWIACRNSSTELLARSCSEPDETSPHRTAQYL